MINIIKINLSDGTIEYRTFGGILHNENGPAIIYPSGTTIWYLNGLRHRENGPAFEAFNGTKAWYYNGKLHRIGLHAVEHLHSKYWFNHGRLHRFNGPAIEHPDGEKEYALYGRIVSEEYYQILKKHPNFPKD